MSIEVKVPDIGDFQDVPVSEVLKDLYRQSKTLDPEGKGVNILLQLHNNGSWQTAWKLVGPLTA